MPNHDELGHRAGFWDDYYGVSPRSSSTSERSSGRRRAPGAQPRWSVVDVAALAGCGGLLAAILVHVL